MYQALYRKWRPRIFDDVIGQKHITDTLKSQVINDRLSHAYIFIGTRGTGKTTCARILAKAVNCEHPINGNPCGVCPACRGIADGTVMDVVELDAASNNSVDNVRALREEAVFSPAAVKKRVYIIDEVHMLSNSAFNALLKIIEEPPEHLMFILATTELQKVPATILSRCQRHSFRRIDAAVLSDYLLHVAGEERFDLTQDAAELIARLAEGGVRDALSLLDQCSAHEHIDVDAVYASMGLAGKRRIEALFDNMIGNNTDEAVKEFNSLWMDGKDPATVLGEINTLCRDILMMRIAPKGGRDLISGGYDPAVLKSYSVSLSSAQLTHMMGKLQGAIASMRDVKNPKIAAELCLITLSDPTIEWDASGFNARLTSLEEKIKNGVAITARAAEDVQSIPTVQTEARADRMQKLHEERAEEAVPPEEYPEYDEYPADRDEPAPYDYPTAEEPDDIMPSFEEEQPEDEFLSRPQRAEQKKEIPQVSDVSWEEICGKIAAVLPVDMRIYPGDSTRLRGRLVGNVLTLEVEPGFVYGRFNKQEIMQKFSNCVSAMTGRQINVIVKEMRTASQAARDLNELKKFPETRVIE